MPSNAAWAGLEAGKTDTRRVSASARWDWFWVVMAPSDMALVLRLKELPEPSPELPQLKRLEIRFQNSAAGPLFYIRLKDSTQVELFEVLCRDVISAGEAAETEFGVLERAVGRSFRWHHLLRGGVPDIMPEESQKGLIGELEVLKLLIAQLGAKAALTAWTGPSGAPKDFELRSDCIEVKARRGASKPFVTISNEFQLADVPDRRIWLAVLAVDEVQPPYGRTLTQRVDEVTELLERTEPSSVSSWELHLADVGYDGLHDYSAWHWNASAPTLHAVTVNFPRIVSPLPLGVERVSYAIALSACLPFHADWSELQSLLVEENRP